MGQKPNDIACLLEAPTAVEAELARGLLEEAGIPCLFHGRDADFAEFGASAHMSLTRPSLFVPAAALDGARALLAEAWGAACDDGDAGGAES
ncbi:MAG TPA: DUF2007 domain-containing protein [Planctomycetota bacterium]|jgi:hypothetical protein|nr:DUF2007 domain-containing protein [Planctomycetota bacterium]